MKAVFFCPAKCIWQVVKTIKGFAFILHPIYESRLFNQLLSLFAMSVKKQLQVSYRWRRKFAYTYVGVINLFFNHSTNVLLTNYSFGRSVRTSTLCMTQVIFKQLFREIISLIIHCITIPVGHKFTYTKLTVPLKSLENPSTGSVSLNQDGCC